MKNYIQVIVGLPKKPKKAQFPTTAVRKIKHQKPLTSFQSKMIMFRNYVKKATGITNINDNTITNEKRIQIRKEALKYASL